MKLSIDELINLRTWCSAGPDSEAKMLMRGKLSAEIEKHAQLTALEYAHDLIQAESDFDAESKHLEPNDADCDHRDTIYQMIKSLRKDLGL
jgi:hypothetical protein